MLSLTIVTLIAIGAAALTISEFNDMITDSGIFQTWIYVMQGCKSVETVNQLLILIISKGILLVSLFCLFFLIMLLHGSA